MIHVKLFYRDDIDDPDCMFKEISGFITGRIGEGAQIKVKDIIVRHNIHGCPTWYACLVYQEF